MSARSSRICICTECVEAETDLNERRAVGVHTEPGGTVDIVGGQSCILTLDEAERLKGEARFLLLSVDSHYRLTVTITPGRV